MKGKHSRACRGIEGCMWVMCAKDKEEWCIRLNGGYEECPMGGGEE